MLEEGKKLTVSKRECPQRADGEFCGQGEKRKEENCLLKERKFFDYEKILPGETAEDKT